MSYITKLLNFWVESHWSVALLMSAVVNVSVFVFTALILSILIEKLISNGQGDFIDGCALKVGQFQWEIRFGVGACFMFALGSLASRELFHNLWPEDFLDLALQTICFILFYETYSYFVHLLLHKKILRRFHSVHHRSVTVTPWSAYSVHPVEAAFIGFSAPIFMLVFPLSLGVALILHVIGMMFTILLHSNFRFKSTATIFHMIDRYPKYHSKHHMYGSVNYGFVGGVWDSLMQTKHKCTK